MAALERVGSSGWYVLGQEVESFEASFAQWVSQPHAIGCASGLDAISLALLALGIEPGDKVLTTPLSAFATTLAILHAGGVPVFVDVDESGLLDLEQAERCLRDHGDIHFMVPVHLFGHAIDLDRLESLAGQYAVKIVEDAAQAVGARSGELPVGSVGQATAFSFYPTKNLGALGDGGCVVTANTSTGRLIRSLRDYGQSAKYVHEHIGLNSRLDELHAAVLRSAYLPLLSGWNQRRSVIASRYLASLDHYLVRPAVVPDNSSSVWHLFPVLVAEQKRDALLAYLRNAGVQAAVHYPTAIPDQPALSRSGKQVVATPPVNARRFAAEEVSLPIHPYLLDREVERVIALINEWQP